ncbi:MAG: hypothetical protein ABTQ29_02750, partial [Siculibacillus sp.]
MSQSHRHDPNATSAPAEGGQRVQSRTQGEDPLEELARILGEGAANPVKPEHVVEVGRRANPSRPPPQQITDLEAQLFEELRSSVAPAERVRGDFEREMPPVFPHHPVDDHDIARLSGQDPTPPAPQAPPMAAGRDEPRWSDYYAYDEDAAPATAHGGAPREPARVEPAFSAYGTTERPPAAAPAIGAYYDADTPASDYGDVPAARAARPPAQEPVAAQNWDRGGYDEGIAAGSYDPAFDHGEATAPQVRPIDFDEAFAAEIQRSRIIPSPPRPTFEDFDSDAIAQAARESSPYASEEANIPPHSERETYEASRHLPHESRGSSFKIALALVGVAMAAGGAWAGWKAFGDKSSSGPITIQADGKPFKVKPDPTKAPPSDGEPTLNRDASVAGSKIVSLQEEPVDQVSGRTPEGREVRVINPGAQRSPTSDQPHQVKTVVVRPDGSIVSDGTTV